jgi:hypothetical protein
LVLHIVAINERVRDYHPLEIVQRWQKTGLVDMNKHQARRISYRKARR